MVMSGPGPDNREPEEVTPVTFMSYNSTGISSVKRKWICDICDELDVDYLAIQEHFKKTKTLDKYFRDNFRGFSSFVIPGYRSPGQDSGRCKAGLAQLSKKAYSIKKERLTTKGFRIQAQVLNMPTCRLLWVNTYMPTDPKRLTQYDDSDLQEVLHEVDTILSCSNYTDVIWSGDLNWDMSRVTFFSRTMAEFIGKLGLVSLWSSYPVNYTYMHTDNKSFSVLDHFLLSPRLLQLVVGCGAVERGDNLSGHCPIWVKLNLGMLPTKKCSPKWVPRKPSWSKADQGQVLDYKSNVQDRLARVYIPQCALSCDDPNCQDTSHSEQRDEFMLDILLAVVESSYVALPLSGGRGGGGHGGKGKAVPVPGWDNVEPFRKEAQYWHGVWVKERRPNRGWLHETMSKCRRQYHYAVRRAKARSNKVRAVKLFEAAMQGDTELLLEMKKIRTGGCSSKGDLPDNVADAEGEEEIVAKFREYMLPYIAVQGQAWRWRY